MWAIESAKTLYLNAPNMRYMFVQGVLRCWDSSNTIDTCINSLALNACSYDCEFVMAKALLPDAAYMHSYMLDVLPLLT